MLKYTHNRNSWETVYWYIEITHVIACEKNLLRKYVFHIVNTQFTSHMCL